MAERDYSHVPLWRKLGLREGSRFRIEHRPTNVRALDDLPTSVIHSRKDADVILAFVTKVAPLEHSYEQLLPRVICGGGLWIAWPKKTSSIPNSLNFETVQGTGLATGWVDNKMCRIDDDWQAIRFVQRRRS